MSRFWLYLVSYDASKRKKKSTSFSLRDAIFLNTVYYLFLNLSNRDYLILNRFFFLIKSKHIPVIAKIDTAILAPIIEPE